MSFISWAFAPFLLIVLAGLWLMPTRNARHTWLLVASLTFYGFGTPWHIVVLLVPALVDYACALRMENATGRRREWLILSLIVNLGVLFYFKYADFATSTIAGVFGATVAPLGLALPIGISFFTFKTMSYTIDVYRGRLAACRSLRDYAMFVSFFPELVAGPIVRASVFLPQLERRLDFHWSRIVSAAPLILLGFSKKLIVADGLARFVDPVFAEPRMYSQGTMAAALVAYALQIYCDFSGYSDIAIGVARIIGFDLPRNFNRPYAATSIADFWRRWHITLSQWLRDYLYVPLGGNRKGRTRTYANLLITMLLGGLWHGASWHFVIWGLYHGSGLAVHRMWREHVGPPSNAPLAKTAAWAGTFAFVCLGWVFFRAESLPHARAIFARLLTPEAGTLQWFYLPFWIMAGLVSAAHVAGALRQRRIVAVRRWLRTHPATAAFSSGVAMTAWLLILLLFSSRRHDAFIYFQF